MNRLYQKNKLTFALVWIGLYVVLLSLADGLSEALGVQKALTAPLCLGMSIFLLGWIDQNRLRQEYGLCRFRGSMRVYLYFLPLALIVSMNLVRGLALNMTVIETLLYMLSMLCVGFLEEIIFRGFLFRAMLDQGSRCAIWVSAVTFGLGHIVNLLNGAEFLPTLLQVCYAVAIGLLFTVMFLRSGSLVPCIITHSAINMLSAVAAEATDASRLLSAAVLTVVPLLYTGWIWKKA